MSTPDRELLREVIECAEDGCFGPLFEKCEDDCECIICVIRGHLKENMANQVVIAMISANPPTFIIAKSEKDPLYDINQYLKANKLPSKFIYGWGGTLRAAIIDFNANHSLPGGTLNDNEEAWYNNPQVTLIGFKQVVDRAVTIPAPIKMPNGQEGYVCEGGCNEFFEMVEANTGTGYKCRKCRMR